MVYVSPKKEIGLVMGTYYHIPLPAVARHYRIKEITASQTLKKLHTEGKDKIILEYLESALPHYERAAEMLDTKKSARLPENIEGLLRAFKLTKKEIYAIEQDICHLKIEGQHYKTE